MVTPASARCPWDGRRIGVAFRLTSDVDFAPARLARCTFFCFFPAGLGSSANKAESERTKG